MKREARLKELRALDEARRQYLHHQQVLKEEEVTQLDREIQKKVTHTYTHTHTHTHTNTNTLLSHIYSPDSTERHRDSGSH